MLPPPLVTCLSTVACDGFRSSRLGPTPPVESAALSVWQLAQLAAKIAAPSGAEPPLEAVEDAPPVDPVEESDESLPQAARVTVVRSAAATVRTPPRRRVKLGMQEKMAGRPSG